MQKDDVAGLLPKVADADVIVLATPVYVDGMTGYLKTLVDRMLPLLHGFFEIRDDHCRHPLRENVKAGKLVLVSASGFTEMDNFDPLLNHVEAICRNMGRDFCGALLRPYGWFFPELKRRGYPIEAVLDAVREAGVQLIRDGEMSPQTLEDVSRDLVSRDVVVEAVNESIKRALDALKK